VVEDDEMRARHPGLPVDPVPGRRAVVWVEVAVEEAYIHCAKHIPHLQKVPARGRGRAGDGPRTDRPREPEQGRAWGTDDVKRKGGDFFGAAAEAREGRRTPPAERPARPEEWLEEAERVLADARRRAAQKGPQPFSGWFR